MPLPTLYRKGYMIDDKDAIPIEKIIEWFQKNITNFGINSRVLILKSTTGSGKSTVLPPEFFQHVNNSKLIICTQPRVLNAISIPKQIIPFFKEANIPLELGKNIGFQTGLLSQKIRKLGIIYMTIGVLYMIMSLLTDEEIIKTYSCIFIDEAHERSTILDCCLYFLKKFLERNKNNINCPFIVIMSATIDINLFADYFEVKNTFHIQGETYPIEKIFLNEDSHDKFKKIYEIAINYHKSDLNPGKYRDILIFLPGMQDITLLQTMFIRAYEKDKFLEQYPILPVVITSNTIKTNPYEIYADIEKLTLTINSKQGKKKYKPLRRVYLGTNVTETGVTISSLAVVIDPGLYNSSEFYPMLESKIVYTKPVTQSMMLQRCGRVGREAPGTAYLIYTEKTFNYMQEIQHPDIIKEDITEFILNLFTQQIQKYPSAKEIIDNYNNDVKIDVFNLNLISTPASLNVFYSLNKLYYYGAIDQQLNITKLGILYGRMPNIPIEYIRTLLMSYVFNVATIDIINILCSLKEKLPIVDTLPMLYNDDFINGMYYFTNITDYLDTTSTDMLVNREDICQGLFLMGFNPYHNYKYKFSTQTDHYSYICKIKHCIYEGFKLNICKWSKNKYINRLNNEINIRGSGINYDLKNPSNPLFILYDTIMLNNKKNTPIFSTSKICILDGFVNVDVFFDSPF